MKPVATFAVAFAVATTASTAAKVMMADPARHAEPQAVSSAESRPSAAPTPAITNNAQPDAVAPASIAARDTARAVAPVADSHAASSNRADTTGLESERRVARVFASMDAKHAAQVLERMSDADVRVILSHVGANQAGQIMAAMPPEKAAGLSKLALSGEPRPAKQ